MEDSMKKKIGKMFMIGVPSVGVTREYEAFCNKYSIGNFCIRADHAISVENTCHVTAALRRLGYFTQGEYPFIGIDQEGGWVTRFFDGAGMLPGAMSYAAAGADCDKMERVGRKLGKILRALGCNVNNAPSLDVNLDPENPIIGTRAYSDKPELVAELGVHFALGIEAEGVLAAVKHFPGHGNVHGDSHTGGVTNGSTADFLYRNELYPFRKAIESGVGATMTAHVNYPAFSTEPATISFEIITELLRKKMNFDGIVITDSMGMEAIKQAYPNGEAAIRAIEAGCDQLLFYEFNESRIEEAIEAVYAAVDSGRITEHRLTLSSERITKQKNKYKISEAAPNIDLAQELTFNEKDIAVNFADKVKSITCIKNDGVLSEITDKKILCISPVFQRQRGVEEDTHATVGFSDVFKGSFTDATACVSSLAGVTPEILPAMEEKYDVAVLGIFRCESNQGQLEILKALKAKGIPIVAVLLSSPYDYKYVSDCNAVITCYEYTGLASHATVEAMKTNNYMGVLPIELPLL